MVGRFDMGQVLLIYPPYRVDISLNLFVVGLVVLFILIYALLRIVRNIWRCRSAWPLTAPLAGREGAAALRDAIGNLYAGRFSRAEKAAQGCAHEWRQQGRGRFDRRDGRASHA